MLGIIYWGAVFHKTNVCGIVGGGLEDGVWKSSSGFFIVRPPRNKNLNSENNSGMRKRIQEHNKQN